ncbi:MAG: Asp23/Gls24 family envelope stress response protein [Saccharofermentanales bacterium]
MMKIRGLFRSTRETERTAYEESEYLRNGFNHNESAVKPDTGSAGKKSGPGGEHPDPPKPRKFPDLRDAFNKISDVMNKNYNERNQAEIEKAKDDIRFALSQINVIAFIGGSGTGKSTRAIKIARQYDISYLIDDGLLINGGRVVAGLSAKRAASKLESVRQALFVDESRAEVMRRALAENLPDRLMILGTSDGMLEKICENLWLNNPSSVIRIEDVTTEEERRKAVFVRSTQGQHTIPVPSMEIKHEFSGYFSDPLNRLLRRSKEKNADVTSSNPDYERTVVRPTFSTLGSYSISDEALADIAGIILRKKVQGAGELLKFEAEKQSYGVVINMEISLLYGFIAQAVLKEVQDKVSKGIEDLTAMNVVRVNIKAKRLVKPDKSGKTGQV